MEMQTTLGCLLFGLNSGILNEVEEDQMEWSLVVWFLIPTAIPLAFFVLFTLFPKRIVQWQGLFYRKWYKEYLQMPDAAVDKLPRLPTDSLITGTRSHFLSRAPEHPEEFPGLLRVYRAIGCLGGVLFILVMALLIWGSITGRLMIAR